MFSGMRLCACVHLAPCAVWNIRWQQQLLGLRALVGQSLAEVRLTHGVSRQEPAYVSDLVEDVVTAAAERVHRTA
jgi:hypothetical protein